jgi:hypothetical protein
MFKIPTETPSWSSDQAAALRQFLNTPSGQIFLQRMFWLRPGVSTITPGVPVDTARRMAEADVQAGYELALQEMINLTVSPE